MRGDHEAFTALAAGSIDRLYATAVLILRDRGAAEDAVQDAMVRAWTGLSNLREADRFGPWLHRLLTHACYDAARARGRRRVEIELMPEHAPSINDASVAIADRDALDRAFRRLSIDHRAVIVMRHFLGLTVPEVAAATSIPVGTAKSRLHHAEQRLRAAIEADSGGRRLA